MGTTTRKYLHKDRRVSLRTAIRMSSWYNVWGTRSQVHGEQSPAGTETMSDGCVRWGATSSCMMYLPKCGLRSHGYIAQWLERLTADQQVPGSNLGVPFCVYFQSTPIDWMPFEQKIRSLGIEPGTI